VNAKVVILPPVLAPPAFIGLEFQGSQNHSAGASGSGGHFNRGSRFAPLAHATICRVQKGESNYSRPGDRSNHISLKNDF
jgi:hypothetical protein